MQAPHSVALGHLRSDAGRERTTRVRACRTFSPRQLTGTEKVSVAPSQPFRRPRPCHCTRLGSASARRPGLCPERVQLEPLQGGSATSQRCLLQLCLVRAEPTLPPVAGRARFTAARVGPGLPSIARLLRAAGRATCLEARVCATLMHRCSLPLLHVLEFASDWPTAVRSVRLCSCRGRHQRR